MKDDVGYEEFLAAVYEAENEETEGKVLTIGFQGYDSREGHRRERKSELKDLKQQIKSLIMIMKSVTIGIGKAKGREGIFSPRKKELLGSSPQKRMQGSPTKGKISLRSSQKPLQCFRCEGWGHGWHECPTPENFSWRELMGAGVLLMPGSPGSTLTQPHSQNQ